ncbi:hypothetical protein J4Q44_G00228200 [Coregonus suidteri]|uniref:FYVE-type domain-containing protein n=1 Tax=Coregonus suidteri TaxID=861788 RepID=A0AAN8LAB6_9TELE
MYGASRSGDGSADGQELGETRKQLKEETLLRLDVEKELEVQIGMKQEMELSMKMLETDMCEKQDALVELRQQLEDLRSLNQQLAHKSQSSEVGAKQKSEVISRLEEKTNQMAGTIKQLEISEKDCVKQARSLSSNAEKLLQKQQSRQAERERDRAAEDNRLFKQEFGDKIDSLQLEVERLRKHRWSLEQELRRGGGGGGGQHIDPVSGEKRASTPQGDPRQVDSIRKELEAFQKENERLCNALEDKSSLGSNMSLSQNQDKEDQSCLEISQASICSLCEQEESMTKTKSQCANCRGVFCDRCLTNELPLPSSINPEHVCDSCYSQLLQQYASSPP